MKSLLILSLLFVFNANANDRYIGPYGYPANIKLMPKVWSKQCKIIMKNKLDIMNNFMIMNNKGTTFTLGYLDSMDKKQKELNTASITNKCEFVSKKN